MSGSGGTQGTDARRGAPEIGFRSYPDLTAKAGKRPSLIRAALRPHKKWVWAFFGVLVVQALSSVAFIATVKDMVDKGVDERVKPLADYASQGLFLAFIMLVSSFGTGYLVRKLSYEIELDLRCWLYTRLHAFDLVTGTGLTSGQVVTRSMADLALVQTVIGIMPVLVAIGPIVLLGTLYLTYLNVIMGVSAMAALVVNFAVVHRMGPRLHALSFAELNERGEVTAAIDEPVRGIRVVHAFAAEADEAAKLEGVARRVFRFAIARARLIARFDLIIKSVPLLTYALVVAVGARLVASDDLTPGTFAVAFQIIAGVAQFAIALDGIASVWQYFIAAQNRLVDVLVVTRPDPIGVPPSLTGDLVIEGLTLEINTTPVLEDVTISLPPGTLGVVHGPPRSGKSLLAATVAGLVHPTSGTVRIGGLEPALLDPGRVGEVVRVVTEEPILFAGTVRSNLALGAPSCTQDDIDRALHMAAADDIVGEREEGLESPVGERGLDLSGGQRQRLALARALVSPPKVLILDDALSAVQPALEHDIVRRIREGAPDTAILYLSRRPGPVHLADVHVELPAPTGPAPVAVPDPPMAINIDAKAMTALLTVAQKANESTDAPAGGVDEPVPTAKPTFANAFIGPFGGLIALALAALAVQTAGLVAPPIMLGTVTDLAEKNDIGAVDIRVAVLVGIAVSTALSTLAFQLLSQRYTHSVLYWMRRRIFEKLLRLGNDHYDRELPGQTATRVVNDLDILSSFLSTAGFNMVVQLAQLLVASGVMIALHAPLVGVVVFTIVASLILAGGQAWLGAKTLAEAREALGQTTSAFEEDLIGTAELRNLGALERRTRRFVEHAWELRRARRRVAYVMAAFGAAIPWIGLILVVVAVQQAGDAALAGTFSVGSVLAIRLLADAANNPLGPLSIQLGQLLDVRVSWRQLARPFDVPELPVERQDAAPYAASGGSIELQGVTFAYPGTGHVVLHDVDLHVAAGEFVAVVGPTGAGKSSISKLVNRTYDPDRGVVRVGGRDVRDLEITSFRTAVGTVPQDAFVFKGTVASNIAYGRPEASRDEVEAAARAVAALDGLREMAGGLDHAVTESGSNLSAAQRQLVALARAWMNHPDVLVLDEATSALDAEQERAVLAALHALGVTVLTVTHRQSVALSADRIVIVGHGAITWQGTPTELQGTDRFTDLFGALAKPRAKRTPRVASRRARSLAP